MHKGAGLIFLLGVSVAAVASGRIGLPAPHAALHRAGAALLPAALQVSAATPASAPAPVPVPAIAAAVARWKSLRQTDNLPFSAYASFLLSYRGWPGEAAMRRTAEQRLSAGGSSAGDVLAYFRTFPPLTPTGRAQYGFALLASGQADEARAQARAAWTSGVLAESDEQRLLAMFAAALGPNEHDARMDVLLGGGDMRSALRTLGLSSAARRPLYEARLALQARASDAAARVAALGPETTGDPGLLLDRVRWLDRGGDPLGARQLAAMPRRLARAPANPERFLETMVALARAASADSQWTLAWQIASQLDDIYPAGTDVSRQSYGERDEYTNLAWIAGTTAMLRLGRPADAAGMFERYARGAQSPQTRSKGYYWAARAASRTGQAEQSNAWLEQAAANPDQFYGQLALERLGRTPMAPPVPPPVQIAERTAFAARPLAEAVRYLGLFGSRSDQTLFIRAIAGQLEDDHERAVASEFGRMIGRLDMGVWAAREARSNGESFYTRPAFPEVSIPSAYVRNWSLAHGIIRQESSFERTAMSPVGARGLMQLMPPTANQTARRVGVPYSLGRLIDDPSYNILLGSHYLSEVLDEWGGNAVLAAAAYNAGGGRVRQWINRNGDPRSPGTDVLRWIEEIPISETRNYVQRVIENAIVYDTINPAGARSRGQISYYLGQRV